MPSDFRNEIIFTEAKEAVEAILASRNAEEIGHRIEVLSMSPDHAQAAMMIFVFKVHGVAEGVSGVELANTHPMPRLYLPPGVNP